jgi:hypothetical protein
MSKNTIIDGIAASEHIDSSGESLSIEGMDISSLGGSDSILNWEHGSKDRPGQVVGKVTFARKIMKKEDAKSQRELYFWNKAKKPFVYIKAELFDGLGHSGAQDVSAMLKYKNKDKGEDSRLVVGFSIEGGKIEKHGMLVTKSIARDVAITVKPCNKICDAEVIEGDVADDFLYKNQNFDCEIIESELSINSTSYRSLLLDNIKKSEWKPSKEDKEQIKELKITPKAKEMIEEYSTDNNMRKALIAGMISGSPDCRTGTAALTPEHLEGKLEKPFTSKAQRKFAYANPEKFGGKEGIKEWESKTPKKLPEKVKKSQQDLSFSKLGPENISRQNVKQVDDPFAAMQAGIAGGYVPSLEEVYRARKQPKDIPSQKVKQTNESPTNKQDENPPQPKIRGVATFDNKKSRAFSMAPTSNPKTARANKGRGEFDTTTQHESLHDHLNKIQLGAPGKTNEEKQNLRNSLVRHTLSHFSPDSIKVVKNYLKTRPSYKDIGDNELNEEVLTHLSDFRSNPRKRNKIYHESGIKDPNIQIKIQNQIKKGWKRLMHPKNPSGSANLTWDKLQEIHNNYTKQDTQPKEVPIQKIPPGVSGIKKQE